MDTAHFNIIPLDERAASYINSEIDSSQNYYSIVGKTKDNIKIKSVFTVIPINCSLDYLYYFESGFTPTVQFRADQTSAWVYIADFIFRFLQENPHAYMIMLDPQFSLAFFGRLNDGYKKFFAGNDIHYFMTAADSLENISAMIAHVYQPGLTLIYLVNTRDRQIDLQSGEQYSGEFLLDLVNNTTFLIVGAYDFESALIAELE